MRLQIKTSPFYKYDLHFLPCLGLSVICMPHMEVSGTQGDISSIFPDRKTELLTMGLSDCKRPIRPSILLASEKNLSINYIKTGVK